MSEHVSGGEHQQPLTPEQAMEGAGAHLDEHGNINYDSFTPEVLQALQDGPGRVTQIVVQDTDADRLPDLVVQGKLQATSAERFFASNSNLELFFTSGFVGDFSRAMQVYQRFAILFPDMDAAAKATFPAYHAGHHARGTHRPESEDVARLYQATFRIMRQLVDANDDAVQIDPENASRLLL